MLLRSIVVQNAGPIAGVRIELPFREGRPLPLVLVGPNGSGKSTLISFVVNALIGFKQQAFVEAEIEQNKVYRVRSARYIRTGAHWYHTRLEFDDGMALEEWVLDRTRKQFQAEVSPLPEAVGWEQIEEGKSNLLLFTPQSKSPLVGGTSGEMRQRFDRNIVLFFPSDRFEPPDWLNEASLSAELRYPVPPSFEGYTNRRIFARALLRPTLEWVKALILDQRLGEFQPMRLGELIGQPAVQLLVLVGTGGRTTKMVDFVRLVLARVLGADENSVRLIFGSRNEGTIGAEWTRLGRSERLRNLLDLSAGQAALFCLFCNLIRDFDLANAAFDSLVDVRGIVVIDEADLHLHVDLQYRVLPDLFEMFPNVQFVLTAHAPLLVMGMKRVFGADGYRVIAMPTGDPIDVEQFTEFAHTLEAFTQTRAFDERVLDRVRQASRPVVLVEGKTDAAHLMTAWAKLNPERTPVFDIVPCGGTVITKRGGAQMLKTMLEACSLHTDRPVVGLFDFDQEGVEQYRGLKNCGFTEATDGSRLTHANRSVMALLLPAPSNRSAFVSQRPRSCFLAIEHYYTDELLGQSGLADDPVVADSAVFGITPDAGKKTRFADSLDKLPPDAFTHFRVLFDELAKAVGIDLTATPLAAATSPASPWPPTFGALTVLCSPTEMSPSIPNVRTDEPGGSGTDVPITPVK